MSMKYAFEDWLYEKRKDTVKKAVDLMVRGLDRDELLCVLYNFYESRVYGRWIREEMERRVYEIAPEYFIGKPV